MRCSSQVKPISYLKANAAEVLLQLTEQREPLVITQNGEAKAVIQDIASYEETQETLALLKILALGNQDIEANRVKPITDVVARLRAKHVGRPSATRYCLPKGRNAISRPYTTILVGSTALLMPTTCSINC